MRGKTRWKAAVIGGMNIDIQGWSTGTFLAGDSNPGRIRETAGGVGRNVAENLVRLGLECSLITVIGGDRRAAWLEEEARRAGIDLSPSLKLAGSPSPSYLSLFDQAGRLEGAVADMAALEALGPDRIAPHFDLLDAMDLLIIDANLGSPSVELVAERYGRGGELERAGRRRPLLVGDPVSGSKAPRLAPVLRRFDLLKPNRAEALVLSGRTAEDPLDLPALASLWASVYDPGPLGLFISLGPEGLYCEGREGAGAALRAIFRPPRLPVRGVSGAGDAALAALAFGSLEGWELGERARAAVAAAALAASVEETVFPALDGELLRATAQGASREDLP